MNEAAKEAMWLKGLSSKLEFKKDNIKLNCDLQSALALARNPVHHERTKHIDTKFYLIRDLVEACDIFLNKIHVTVDPVDFLTKTIPGQKFQLCCEILNVHSLDKRELKVIQVL